MCVSIYMYFFMFVYIQIFFYIFIQIFIYLLFLYIFLCPTYLFLRKRFSGMSLYSSSYISYIFIHFCFLNFAFYIFHIFCFNFSMICVSDYVLLSMSLNVCVQLYVNVCMVFLCAFILSYSLCQVSHERQEMLSQWTIHDSMGQTTQRRRTVKHTLVPPYKCFNK